MTTSPLTWQTPPPTRPGPWRIKAGFDPTSPDLHLGHAVLFLALREWQEQGHDVLLLVGDFTATIGDPTGRQNSRPPLTQEQVTANAKTYAAQAFRFLDPSRTQVVHNQSWFGTMSAAALLALAEEATVAQLLVRQDFRTRHAAGASIGLHELLYPVLQGYDSVQLQADVELGGEDQLFNLHMGRTMQERRGQPAQSVATVPLLMGLDGVRKMSKSLGNHIALTDIPQEVYGKTMRLSDEQVPEWSRLLQQPFDTTLDAYASKRALARGLCALLHGPEASASADADWEQRFVRREVALEAPEHAFSQPCRLAALLVELGWVDSMTQARQKVREGAVRLDGVKCLAPQQEVGEGMLELGRRHAARLVAQPAPSRPKP